MRVVWLAWFICSVCLLLALFASAITYHLDVQHLGVVLPAAFGGVALLAGPRRGARGGRRSCP
jgi:hypothetical protein